MFAISFIYLARMDSISLLCYGMAHKRCIRGGCHSVELLNSDKVQMDAPTKQRRQMERCGVWHFVELPDFVEFPDSDGS